MAKPGRKPFGLTPEEKKIVALIKLKARVRRGGKKPVLSAVARDLNRAGHRTRTGKLWRTQTVKNVLAGSREATGSKSVQRVKKTGLGTGDYLTSQQLQGLFEAAQGSSPDNTMILAVMVGSGLRASELCALEVRDLGIYSGKSQIDVRRGKGYKQRCIFISTELSAELRGYLAGKHLPRKSPVFVNCLGEPLAYEALYKRVRKLGTLAGMPELRPHVLRHTFGTRLYNKEKDLFFVKEQLGHSKVDTTQIYAKTLTESKLTQMNAFGSDLSALRKTKSVPDNDSKPETDT